jgi:zinc transport system substrate-binding protein
MKILQQADCFFYIADNMDNWAIKIQAKKKIKMLDLVPKSSWLYFNDEDECNDPSHKHEHKHSHDKNDVDPHFWTDPLTVKKMLPNLLKKLNEFNPELSKVFKSGTEKFSKKLDELNNKVITKLSKYKGENIFLFHPSFLYFLKQYGLNYAGSIEPSPGKEPSTKSTMNLVKKIKSYKAKALYTEPQLPESPVKVIAEASELKIYKLDPLGGVKGREQYFEFIMYNTNIFVKSFE